MISYKFHKGDNYWDITMLKDILKDSRFTTDESDGCVYVVAGEYETAKNINSTIDKYKWVVLIVTSDEQSKFDIENINHPNIKIWVQYPKIGRHDKYGKLPIGYTPHTKQKNIDKKIKAFFSGQVTHKRRIEVYEELKKYKGAVINKTDGFTKGLPPDEYMDIMNRSKAVVSPGGPVCPDSFRTYEALECGAVPIAEMQTDSDDKNEDYLYYLLGVNPILRLDEVKDLHFKIDKVVKSYPHLNTSIYIWWLQFKRDLKQRIIEDIQDISKMDCSLKTTVIVPVSPIKSHPSTVKLKQCIDSVRHHLPDSEIIITFDGVRKEQQHLSDKYLEFIRRALILCNKWNATPVVMGEHSHQVKMLRHVIEAVETPTITYVEGDTGFVVDKSIDFDYCYEQMGKGTSNLIRFHFESKVPKDHQHMILKKHDKLIETAQWSQRPHIASTEYYKRVLKDYFSEGAKSFIEDKLHGICWEDYKIHGRYGWEKHKLHIYAPEKDIKYSVDFDGREGDEKFEQEQVF